MAAFLALAALVVVQLLFGMWAIGTAAHHSERSNVATRMLAEYLEIAGNKQRLKVWFAQRMLANDNNLEVRDRLSTAMAASVYALRALLPKIDPAHLEFERSELELVAQNITLLDRAVRTTKVARLDSGADAAEQWRSVLNAFDELAGRDMRDLLREAVDRHASLRESELLNRTLARIRLIGGLPGICVVLGAMLAVAYFVRRLGAPFAQLTQLTHDLAAGNYSARSALAGRDEFSQIGRLLDNMADKLAAAQAQSSDLLHKLEQLVAERTRALTQAYDSLLSIESRRRQFFAELSHELRTPVTVIRGEAELLLRGQTVSARTASDGSATPDSEVKAALQRIVVTSGELGVRVQEMLEAARGTTLDFALSLKSQSFLSIVDSAVRQMQAVATRRGVKLRLLEPAAGVSQLVVSADRDRLQQALVIVLDNALRYAPVQSEVEVILEHDEEYAWVYVRDAGPGMSEADFTHAFEPHYRGSVGQALEPTGAGIGLAIANRIVSAHRGVIELKARQPQGLEVSLGIPFDGDSTSKSFG